MGQKAYCELRAGLLPVYPFFRLLLFAFKWFLLLLDRKDQPVGLLFDALDKRIQLGNQGAQLLKVALEQAAGFVDFGPKV
jgi:hypothetical protein